MLFRNTKFRQATYVIEQADWEFHGTHRKRVPGISVKFNNYTFDSQQAQQVNRWNDETRHMVEAALMDHTDYGSLIQVVPDEQEERLSIPFIAERCVFTIVTDEGPAACGEKVSPHSEWYCERHERAVSAASDEEQPAGTQIHGRASSLS